MTDELELYSYDGYGLLISPDALSRAERRLEDHLEEAEETGEDRTGTQFCGCTTCANRVATGFWLSWLARALQNGTAAYAPEIPHPATPRSRVIPGEEHW